MIVVRNTENVKISEKMLELKGDELNLNRLADIGKMWEATHHHHSSSNGLGHGLGGNINLVQRGPPGEAPNRRQQQMEIVCFICNFKGHMARECKSDRAKMRCNDCGDSNEFGKWPHNTGAKYCPRNKPPSRQGRPARYERSGEKTSNARRMKVESESDYDPSDCESGDDSSAPAAKGRASCWCNYVKFYNGHHTEDMMRCVVVLG